MQRGGGGAHLHEVPEARLDMCSEPLGIGSHGGRLAGLRLEDHDLPLDGDGGRSRRRKTDEQGEGAEEEPHRSVVAGAGAGTICPWRARPGWSGSTTSPSRSATSTRRSSSTSSIFDLQVESRIPGMAFITMGDQFLALAEGRTQPPDDDRHFGLVVDDKEAALAAARDAGVEMFGKGNDFRDPWGNFIQVVEYSEIQFTKAPQVLRGMDLDGIGKSERALEELRQKGLV